MTTPQARKTRRSFAIDPRLVIGLVLVAGSIAGVVGIVSAADETVQVYAARDPLSPGDRIDSDDLETRNVRLDATGDLYLVPGDVPGEGFVVTRSVDEGELIPASAVGKVDGVRLASIVLQVGGQLAASVVPGSVADIWAAREVENGTYGPPAVIVSGATVARVVQSESIVGAGEATAVEVLVPKSRIARVLEAVANSDAVSIVPANIPGRS